MAIGKVDIPSAFRTKDPDSREDLQRLRRVLEQLRAQMVDLQEQIDAAGGGAGTITEITSADASVSITNGTGPVVDLSVSGGGGGTPDPHATSHQNGGSDEVNVAGLSGVLADGQRANKLVATGTDVSIDPTPPTAGQVLTASSATAASWQSGQFPISAFWWYPATAHSEDREMEDGTNNVPSGWSLGSRRDLGGGTDSWGTITIDGDVVWAQSAPPLDSHCRIGNGTGRRSWLQLQPSRTGGATGYQQVMYRTITAASGSRLVLKTRMSGMQQITADSTNGGFFAFYLTLENSSIAGKPDMRVTNGWTFRPQSFLTSGVGWQFVMRKAGADVYNTNSVSLDGGAGKYAQVDDFELVCEIDVSVNGKTWVWINSAGDKYELTGTNGGGDDAIGNALAAGNPVYVAYAFHSGTSAGETKIFGIDYFRRQDSAYAG